MGYHAMQGEPEGPCVSPVKSAAQGRQLFSALLIAMLGVAAGVALTLSCVRVSERHGLPGSPFVQGKFGQQTGKLSGRYGYSNVTLPMSNTTTLAVAETPHFLFVFALGKDRNVYEKHVPMQLVSDYVVKDTQADGGLPWSEWAPIFRWNRTALQEAFRHAGRDPNNITQADMPLLAFDGDPAVGVNPDGRVEVFARYTTNLDVWQTYQLDPLDPSRWSNPRESGCIFQDPSEAAKDPNGFIPSKPTREEENTSVPDAFPECDSALYWNGQPVFPTSDLTVVPHPVTQRLRMFFRGFTGQLYFLEQMEANNSTKYGPPVILDAIMV